MPRNSSGVFTLASAAFVPNTTISSSAVNADLSDIATALTQSLATTGVSTMTGQLLCTSGNASAPGYGFASDTATGFYLPASHQIGVTINGTPSVTFNSNFSVTFIGTITANIGTIPVGAVMDFAGVSAPAGWLLCFGQAVSRATYVTLFGIIGTTYGIGDGSTTFNLPDYRGRITAGQDNMGGSSAGRIGTVVTDVGTIVGTTLGSTGGSTTHAQTTSEMPVHSHANSLTDPGHTHTYNEAVSSGNQKPASGGTAPFDSYSAIATSSNTTGITITNANAGSGNAMAIMQPTIITNKIIFVGL